MQPSSQESPPGFPIAMRPWRAWRGIWRDRGRFHGELTTVTAVTVLGIIGLTYSTIALFCQWRGFVAFDPMTSLDAAIPVLPWTIVLYSTHFIYFPIALATAPRSDTGRMELLLLLQAQILIALASFTVFLALPVEIEIVAEARAALTTEPTWIRSMFGFVYWFDVPWNAWPSLHITQSLINVGAITLWSRHVEGRRPLTPRGGARRPFVIGTWIVWVGLVLSILTTRQHYLLDFITGLFFGAVGWFTLLRPAMRRIEAQGAGKIADDVFGI